MAVDPRIKTFVLVSLLILIPLSSETVAGFRGGMSPKPLSFYKVGIPLNTRKLLLYTLDYEDTGPNPKHDPRKKPGHP